MTARRIRILTGEGPKLAAIRELIQRAFAEQDGRIDPPSSAGRLTLDDVRAQARPPGRVLVAEADGVPVGCLFLVPEGEVLHIGKLAVDPSARGRGHARALMIAAEDFARRDGYARLELQTRIELMENHALFRRLGYVETARAAHPGYDRATSITFTRNLNPER